MIILIMLKDQLEDLLKTNRFGVLKLQFVVLFIVVMIMYRKPFIKLRIILWFQIMFKILRRKIILAYLIILGIILTRVIPFLYFKAIFILVVIQKTIILMTMIKYYQTFRVRPLNHVIIRKVARIRVLMLIRLEG